MPFASQWPHAQSEPYRARLKRRIPGRISHLYERIGEVCGARLLTSRVVGNEFNEQRSRALELAPGRKPPWKQPRRHRGDTHQAWMRTAQMRVFVRDYRLQLGLSLIHI